MLEFWPSGALCLLAVCKFICHKLTGLNFGIELDGWHHQFVMSILQDRTIHDGSSGKTIAMFYVMWWWYHSTGWSRLVTRPSFKGLFRLVEFWEFFLQGSEWRRGERLHSAVHSKMSLDNVCGKGRELACTPSILSTGLQAKGNENEVKGNAKQQ